MQYTEFMIALFFVLTIQAHAQTATQPISPVTTKLREYCLTVAPTLPGSKIDIAQRLDCVYKFVIATVGGPTIPIDSSSVMMFRGHLRKTQKELIAQSPKTLDDINLEKALSEYLMPSHLAAPNSASMTIDGLRQAHVNAFLAVPRIR